MYTVNWMKRGVENHEPPPPISVSTSLPTSACVLEHRLSVGQGRTYGVSVHFERPPN